MYAEIERLIKEVLQLEDSDIYDISMSEEDVELQLNAVLPIELIRDLLLEYYSNKSDYAFVSQTLIQNCHVDPLNVIELLEEVDALKNKTKDNLH